MSLKTLKDGKRELLLDRLAEFVIVIEKEKVSIVAN